MIMFVYDHVYGHVCLWSCSSAYDRTCLSSYLSVYYPCLILPACFLIAATLLPAQHRFRATARQLEKVNITALALIFAVAL